MFNACMKEKHLMMRSGDLKVVAGSSKLSVCGEV
jgi:hypothetical protein